MTWRPRALPTMMVLAVLAAGAVAWWQPLRAQPPGGGGRRGRPGGGLVGSEGGGASALAVLQGVPGGPRVEGAVLFFVRGGSVQVVADVSGIDKPGLYALHLHEKGECKADPAGKQPFASAGGDFDPGGDPHACADAARHHAGDLGNIEVQADGTGHLELVTSALTFSGARSVLEKAVILHAGADDCATQPDGNSGARLACGVAERVDDRQSRQPRRRGRAPGGSVAPPL